MLHTDEPLHSQNRYEASPVCQALGQALGLEQSQPRPWPGEWLVHARESGEWCCLSPVGCIPVGGDTGVREGDPREGSRVVWGQGGPGGGTRSRTRRELHCVFDLLRAGGRCIYRTQGAAGAFQGCWWPELDWVVLAAEKSGSGYIGKGKPSGCVEGLYVRTGAPGRAGPCHHLPGQAVFSGSLCCVSCPVPKGIPDGGPVLRLLPFVLTVVLQSQLG